MEQCWACCSTALDCWFGVYPQPVYTPNRCIHPTGVNGQSRHHANLPDTFSSKKVLGVEQCWACCSTAWTAGSGYTPNRCIPPTGVYTQPVYMASRGTTPTFRTHSLLKKFWVWSNVGHAAQQRGRPVRGIPPTGVYPEPAVHAVEQHAQHCSTPKTFLEENVSGRLAWCLDWPYTPVGCIHRFRCIWSVKAPRQPSRHILF